MCEKCDVQEVRQEVISEILNQGLNQEQLVALNTTMQEVHEWSRRNFKGTPTLMVPYGTNLEGQVSVTLGHLAPLMGLVEEYGEYVVVCARTAIHCKQLEAKGIKDIDDLMADTPSSARGTLEFATEGLKVSNRVREEKKTELERSRLEALDSIGDFGIYFCDYLAWTNTTFDDINVVITDIVAEVLGLVSQDRTEAIDYFGQIPIHLGTLFHIELKRLQKIRGMDNQDAFKHNRLRAAARLFLSWLVNSVESHVDPFEALQITWNTVKQRDWEKNRATGSTLEQPLTPIAEIASQS